MGFSSTSPPLSLSNKDIGFKLINILGFSPHLPPLSLSNQDIGFKLINILPPFKQEVHKLFDCLY